MSDAPIYVFNTDNKEPVQYDDNLDLKKIRAKTIEMCENDDVPLVSIIIQAYNKLDERTKYALHFIKKYTSHINAELILIDNGSTDGTFDYFKNFNFPRKRIVHVTKNLGSVSGGIAVNALVNHTMLGKYIVVMGNSILVTKNWLDNLVTCMESDDTIGMAVTMSNFPANYQGVELKSTTVEDMEKKAAEFNVSEPTKWEERIRLITTSVTIFRREVWYQIKGDLGFVHNFGDDDLSFQVRRLGYKLIVCGDTFVYRIPHITTGMDSKAFNNDLEKGREMFKEKYYGIDAWSDTCNHRFDICKYLVDVSVLEKENKKHSVLGFDARCGMPLLQLKNELRKVAHDDVTLSAYFEDAKFWLDLKTVCAGDVICADIEKFPQKLKDKYYTEIIFSEYIDAYENPKKMVEDAFNLLSPTGCLGIKFRYYKKQMKDLDEAIDIALKNQEFKWRDEFVEFIESHENWKVKGIEVYKPNSLEVAKTITAPGLSGQELEDFRERFKLINTEYILIISKREG